MKSFLQLPPWNRPAFVINTFPSLHFAQLEADRKRTLAKQDRADARKKAKAKHA